MTEIELLQHHQSFHRERKTDDQIKNNCLRIEDGAAGASLNLK